MSYPTVDISFIVEQMEATGMLEENGHVVFSKSHAFIFEGHKPLHKRRVYVREFDSPEYAEAQVSFMNATGIAIIYGFMGELLKWFERERNWIEGGYSAKL